MIKKISIRTSKDIKTNYAQISELAQKHPVVITVNGKVDTVLMSHADFMDQQHTIEQLQERLELYTHLAQAKDDIMLGRVHSMYAVVDDIYKDIEKLEI